MAAKKPKQTRKRERDVDADIDEDGKPGFFDSIKQETLRGVIGVVIFVSAIILALAALHLAGVAGDKLFAGVYWVVGIGYYLVPVMLVAWALTFFKGEDRTGLQPVRTTGAVLGFLAVLGTLGVLSPEYAGALGKAVAYPLVTYLEKIAALIILGGLIIISLLFLFDSELWVLLGKKIAGMFRKEHAQDATGDEPLPEYLPLPEEDDAAPQDVLTAPRDVPPQDDADDYIVPVAATQPSSVPKQKPKKDVFVPPSAYNAPPLSLLRPDRGEVNSGNTKANQNAIRITFQHFNIPVEMDETTVGPSVTRYALKPAEGVRLSKITSLQQNLELALSASPIRIEAPIPGRPLVGIEVPNKSKSIVGLEGLLAASTFYESPAPLLFALGKSISGEMHYADVSEMPHLLIAGATKSGKSVMVHSLITSLLYRNGPDRLRFILVDPKQVELTLYEGLPHLLTPVIIEPKKCILALTWAGKEMERRYGVLREHHVRDVHEYHEQVLVPWLEAHQNVDPSEITDAPEPMHRIVVVIDELADIMSAYPRELEAAIVRLAQKSRAVGIHLVLSTQRPSVDVVTGLIKANLPARIALKVNSGVDSRIILDELGAEKLLGYGDMLFKAADMPKPRRIQSPFLTTEEVKAVVKHIVAHNDPQLDEPIEFSDETPSGGGGSMGGGDGGERDALYVDIKNFVIRERKASTSLLQRKFNIGYGRAARIMDFLEEDGIIAPSEGGNKARIVLPGAGAMPGGDAGFDGAGDGGDERTYA
jgi:S-DNA-T family DNA segregation ATPase FtsK/SpoIIIE